mgnify:FL=1
MKLKIVKGTRDIRNEELKRFQIFEKSTEKIFPLYGYNEIRTPIMERTELFAHGVGEETDIVGKEMFLLEDRRKRSLALRPEGTAQIVRNIITNDLMKQNKVLKYYYIGPMFRYEQPQKGRYRQFHQIGAEYFGVETPDADLELILMLRQLFNDVKLKSVAFQLNSIGCLKPNCRPQFKSNLVQFLKDNQQNLCDDCQKRLTTNPLRILDCKNEKCIQIANGAPKIYEAVCEDCSSNFNDLQNLLEKHNVTYELNEKLVRGLDYYSRTVFEVYSSNLGAQSAAGGGGRYDGLFDIYGAKTVPAIGFALGLDRLTMLLDKPKSKTEGFFVIGSDQEAVIKLVSEVRESNQKCLYDPHFASMKSQFRQANKALVKKVLILGEEEIKNNQIAVKNMATSEQVNISADQLAHYLEN